MKDHKKHPAISKPSTGEYHAVEWAIYGTTCSKVESFVEKVKDQLPEYQFLFVDADHNKKTEGIEIQYQEKVFHAPYSTVNEYDQKLYSESADMVFVNGNHFPASRQIVIIDENKEASLEKRIPFLTNLEMVIIKEDEIEIFDFLKPHIQPTTKIVREDNFDLILHHFIEINNHFNTPLKALILAGGKSSRMGVDKSNLVYHENSPHQLYLSTICQELGLETFISKSELFNGDMIDGIPVLKDRFVGLGPFGAILTAMMHDRNSAWLVIACDLPFLDRNFLKELISNRNMSKYATAVKGYDKPFPEPLITIYEPRAYTRLLQFLSLGKACPRKMLINSDVEIMELEENTIISNANTMEERQEILKMLGDHEE